MGFGQDTTANTCTDTRNAAGSMTSSLPRRLKALPSGGTAPRCNIWSAVDTRNILVTNRSSEDSA